MQIMMEYSDGTAAPRMRRVSRNLPLQALLPLVLRRASHEARE